jgi:hypothetical protein
LVYSTFLGGSNYDVGHGIAVDKVGNAYVTGETNSTSFPTKNPLQPTYGGNQDAFVTEINVAGSALVYSTYLGGSNYEVGQGIAVDGSGNAYVAGFTESTDFPTKNPLQPANGGGNPPNPSDAFVTKISPAGSTFVYSTYLGGSGEDIGYAIAADRVGNAYVTGRTASANFPVTPGAFQTTSNGGSNDNPDVFVSKFNPSGSALVYSTYLGGPDLNYGLGIAVDGAGSAYVTGFTVGNFPVTPNAFQTKTNRTETAFLTKFNSLGSALAYSTYLHGTNDDHGNAIAVDTGGNAYVVGQTDSTDFPTTPGTFQTTYGGGPQDAFIAKIYPIAATTTKVSSSLNPSTYGQSVTFTAGVTSALGAPPDGETITFKKGGTVLGTGTLSGGTASFSTSALTVGTKTVTAVYGGDSHFSASTSKLEFQVVNKATTTTSLTSSQNPSSSGQSVMFTAMVAPQFSGKPTGTVTFYDGSTILKTVSLTGGVAKFTTSNLTKGAHTIKATYSGDVNFDGSSASLTQTVN